MPSRGVQENLNPLTGQDNTHIRSMAYSVLVALALAEASTTARMEFPICPDQQ